jgi:hypothetical protein
MGCGCGKTSTPAQAFVYTSPQGKQTTYTSQVQAQAAGRAQQALDVENASAEPRVTLIEWLEGIAR